MKNKKEERKKGQTGKGRKKWSRKRGDSGGSRTSWGRGRHPIIRRIFAENCMKKKDFDREGACIRSDSFGSATAEDTVTLD